MQTVGIIGGLGPETTAEFYLQIIASCQVLERTHRPSVLIASVPMPYAVEKEIITSNQNLDKVLPFLTESAQILEKAGADFLVMPCNSLHIFQKEISQSVDIPFLSLIDSVADYLQAHRSHHIGILGTDITLDNRLYQNSLDKKDIEYETPRDSEQKKMGSLIHHLVNGRKKESDRDVLQNVIYDFEQRDADSILLACTDLQLLKPQSENLPIYDSMEILAENTVKRMLEIEEVI